MSRTVTKSIQRKMQDNLQRVRDRIARACERARRDPASVRLIAVTKSVEVDVIRVLLDRGQTDLGESRVQTLTRRAAMIGETLKRQRMLSADRSPAEPIWHMVGHLQRNKAKAVLEWSNIIHSLDSLRLAEQISGEARNRERVVDVFLQVNVAGEREKHGIAVGALGVLVEQLRALPGLRLVGLMTMVPRVDHVEEVRPYFRRLRELAEDLRTEGAMPPEFRELSMGMSNDFEVAVEEGATLVRIGTVLFEGLTAART